MRVFEPDYTNLQNAAFNKTPRRLPLYEHIIVPEVMEQVLEKELTPLYMDEKDEYFNRYCAFYETMGYDTVSFEGTITSILPGGGALYAHADPVIKTRADFERYPWAQLPDLFFERYAADYDALARAMPNGMRAVGGPGNGVFECVQDLVGYEGLCYMLADDPALVAELFKAVGDANCEIWRRFLPRYGDAYCVLRFGDDLGFKSTTLLAPRDIREYILPQYKRFTDLVHSYKKPFLLHCCGSIFDVMDELINEVGIDAKHSNEDVIAPFWEWVDRYGERIGNFGGIDTDAVCSLDKPAMREYIAEVLARCEGRGGFAFGSGNSIPDYVPAERYMNMVEIVREHRGA